MNAHDLPRDSAPTPSQSEGVYGGLRCWTGVFLRECRTQWVRWAGGHHERGLVTSLGVDLHCSKKGGGNRSQRGTHGLWAQGCPVMFQAVLGCVPCTCHPTPAHCTARTPAPHTARTARQGPHTPRAPPRLHTPLLPPHSVHRTAHPRSISVDSTGFTRPRGTANRGTNSLSQRIALRRRADGPRMALLEHHTPGRSLDVEEDDRELRRGGKGGYWRLENQAGTNRLESGRGHTEAAAPERTPSTPKGWVLHRPLHA